MVLSILTLFQTTLSIVFFVHNVFSYMLWLIDLEYKQTKYCKISAYLMPGT